MFLLSGVPRHFLWDLLRLEYITSLFSCSCISMLTSNSSGNKQKHGYLGCFHAASARENISWVCVICVNKSAFVHIMVCRLPQHQIITQTVRLRIYITSQIAKIIGSISIRHWSHAKVSDWCPIDVDLMVFAIRVYKSELIHIQPERRHHGSIIYLTCGQIRSSCHGNCCCDLRYVCKSNSTTYQIYLFQ